MKYFTGRSPEILGLLKALRIPPEGVMGVCLIVEPNEFVRLDVQRFVTADEMHELTEWFLKSGIEAEQRST
tara:strand:+ start:148 stop:360 length:213 start_codon:yes stop_codon:yes gene_type:complete